MKNPRAGSRRKKGFASMPSRSLIRWQTDQRAALDQIDAAHSAVGGAGRGRRYATQQINQAYAMLLSSQFQSFCRNLHSEAVDHVCGPVGAGGPRLDLLRLRLMAGRKLDKGNPNPGNIGEDFWFFDLDLWDAVRRRGSLNRRRQQYLEELNVWRNAIAHQDFTDQRLRGRTAIRLGDVQSWRRACDALAVEFDAAVGAHLRTIVGANPW
jgi:hypothetical protein